MATLHDLLLAGRGALAGRGVDSPGREASRLLDDPAAYAAMANRVNPSGDGTASRRTVARLLEMAGHSG